MTTDYSDSEFTEWLAAKSGPRPVVLVIAQHSAGTVYFSDRGYTSWTTDTPANIFFDGIITKRIVIEHRLDLSTIGNIQIINDGDYTAWLAYKWRGWPLQIYLGDARWRFVNFRKIADVINGGISAKGDGTYDFSVTDSGFSLDEVIGGEQTPVAFGNPINVTASMIDQATLRYKVHSGLVADLADANRAHDSGLAVNINDFLNIGEFTLTGSPAGMITATLIRDWDSPKWMMIDLLTYMSSKVGDELLDVTDALLPDPDNTNSTVMTFVDAIVTYPVVDGDYVLDIELNSSPANGGKGELAIADLISGSIAEGTTVRLEGDIRHVGSGGLWMMQFFNVTATIYFMDITSTDTDWIPFSLGFIYGTGSTMSDSLRVQELNASSDGGVQIRNLALYKSPIQFDADNLEAYDLAAGTGDSMGIFVNSPTSVRTILDMILQSHGGYYRVTPNGTFEVHQLDVPATSSLVLLEDDIEANGVTHVRTEPPIKILTLKYKKNWTIQGDGVAGAVHISVRAVLAKEWFEVTSENDVSDYPIAEDQTVETYIVAGEEHAEAEADRRQVIRSVKREVFIFKTYLAAAQISVGDTITITYPAYGFESGKDMVVIEIKRNLGTRRITITVWG